MIRTIVITEGDERTVQHENIDYWRIFLARFGMEETEMSLPSLYQVKCLVI